MTNPPDQPSGANEFAPLENTPQHPDPYAPVDYPSAPVDYPSVPPTVLGPGYPPPPGYSQASGYPPPPPLPGGYPGGYPDVAAYPPPPGYPAPPPMPPYGGGYPYAADPYSPYGQIPPQHSTSGMAIAALVVSLASLVFTCGTTSFIGAILGVLGMRETKRTGQEGYGLALAGLIIGAIPAVLWIVWLVFLVFFSVVGSSSSYT